MIWSERNYVTGDEETLGWERVGILLDQTPDTLILVLGGAGVGEENNKTVSMESISIEI